MKIKARAKVNLALDVVQTMDNGYHELDMIMAPISLYNDIEIDVAPVDQITCDTVELPENSTIHRTLQILRKEKHIQNAYRIHVQKHIPDQAGLAGSSADAAAVFKAILEWEQMRMSQEEQLRLAKQIGADVPFCMVSKTARVGGIGEVIRCIDTDWTLRCLLVKPSYGISTPEAFKIWEQKESGHVNVDRVEECIQKKAYADLMHAMGNALEIPAFCLCPQLQELKESMQRQGLDRIMMTGSGSALMGFSQNNTLLQSVKEFYQKQGYFSEVVTIG